MFTPDPRSTFVGLTDVTTDFFHNLPAHPAQRQTELHAAKVIASGVLSPPLDLHREVAVVLIGDPTEMAAAYNINAIDTIRIYGAKLNGHTRDFIWQGGAFTAPEMLRVSVYAAADIDAAVQLYNAMDSLQSSKGAKDEMQSTLNIAGLEPVSDYMRVGGGLAQALNLADWVLFGGLEEYRRVRFQGSSPDPLKAALYRLLPHLGSVEHFLDAIRVLDGLDIKKIGQAFFPTGGGFVAGYLSILYRDPDNADNFLLTLADPKEGAQKAGKMDAIHALRQVHGYLYEPRRMQLTKPQKRVDQCLAAVLNCYQAWAEDEEAAFPADNFRSIVNTSIIKRFNPIEKGLARQLRDGVYDEDQPTA